VGEEQGATGAGLRAERVYLAADIRGYTAYTAYTADPGDLAASRLAEHLDSIVAEGVAAWSGSWWSFAVTRRSRPSTIGRRSVTVPPPPG